METNSMAKLIFRASLTERGGSVNEDAVGFVDGSAWVIDGATGFGPRRYTPGESDARWYAQTLDGGLRAAAAREGFMPQAMLAAAITDVADQFAALGIEVPAAEDVPAAAVAVVRATAAGLAYAILGDCALLAPAEGRVRVINDPIVGAFDRRFAEEISVLHAEGILDPASVTARMAASINRVRQSMNRPDGYWIAALMPEAAQHAESGILSFESGTDILLASDGLLRLIEPFHAYDPAGLLAAAGRNGLRSLLHELRGIERADPNGREFPRLKAHDDASGLLLTWSN
jgi:hypothetical protein